MSMTAGRERTTITYRRGVVLVLSAGLCWSVIGLVVRSMEAATAWQILFYRSASLTVFLFLVVALRSRALPLASFRRAGLSGILGGLCLVLAFAGSILSLLNTSVANAMLLFATAPFFAALFARLFLGEAVRRATWISMACATLGVAIMVRGDLSIGQLEGNLWAVGSAIGFALFTIALRWGRSEDMLPAVTFGGLFMTVLAAIVCWITEQSFLLSTHDTALAVSLGVFQLGLGLSLFTLGSKVVPAAELALLSMTEVVLGPIWVFLFLGERAGPYTMLGGLVLLAAIAGNALTRLRHPPPPLAP